MTGLFKKPTIWTWVVKLLQIAKIPIVQVDWWFKLIQYSLNSKYCLRKLNENSKKAGVYVHVFLPTKIVTAQTWPSTVSDYWIKIIGEQSLYRVTFHYIPQC